jgi:hypothetical protein
LKYILSFLILILSLSATYAQKFEVGAGLGVCHYKGDLSPTFKPFQFGPGGNAFFRYNHSRALSAKVGFMYGQVRAKDKNNQRDLFLQKRNLEFSKWLPEMNFQVEYNFLNFRTNASRIVSNWTPYVLGGAMYLDRTTGGWLLGVGLKKEWRRNWNWGVEFGTRMPFQSDTAFDGLGFYEKGGTTSNKGEPNIPVAITRQGDKYYYTNFSVSYVFYKVYCPPSR